MATNRRQLLPFGLEWADVSAASGGPEREYPLPINGRPTAREVRRVGAFASLVAATKASSFYSGPLNHPQGVAKPRDHLEGGVNDGIQRYSDKYRRRIKVSRSLVDHPFQAQVFPPELQVIVAPRKGRGKTLGVASVRANGQLELNIDRLINHKQEIMDRLEDVEANANANVDEDEEPEEEENIDDEFEDEDDDDYNAEKYFDDGDEYEEDQGDDEAAF